MLSMTGFGRACAEISGSTVTAEISSINRKQLELRISLPADLAGYEIDLRNIAAKYFSRGAVSVRVSVSRTSKNGMTLPDPEKLDALIN